MPLPKKGESKEEYISRYMNSEEAKKSFPDEKQRIAVAESEWKKHHHSKERETPAFSIVSKITKTREENNVKYDDEIQVFYGATTLPARLPEVLSDGTKIEGEILSKKVLDKYAGFINDESKLGGEVGSYRTISMAHDRVYLRDPKLEPAGFVVPGSAEVIPHEKYPGHYALKVETKTNKFYTGSPMMPDYNAEKINYMIDNCALGLSVEYNNKPEQEKIIDIEGKKYRYIMDSDDFRGFGYARANVIADPAAISIREINDIVEKQNNKIQGELKMDETKIRELETKYEESQQKVRELSDNIKTLKSSGDSNTAKMEELNAKIRELSEKAGDMTKLREALADGFKSLNLQSGAPINTSDKVGAKTRELVMSIESASKEKPANWKSQSVNWYAFMENCDTRIRENSDAIVRALNTSGIRMEEAQTLKVRCMGSPYHHDGRMLVEPSAKTRELLAKTRDTIDANDMNEATYYQTNAFFSDRYVPGITETFLKSDSLLTAMNKEQFAGGNDKYQWRIWTQFGTFTGANTAAVDPNVTSVATTEFDFVKLETPIREYRKAVEITDFTQFHSTAAVGSLMEQEILRAAEFVTNSLDADLFKGYGDGSTGWVGVNGLLYIADSATYTTLYGRTRSAANRLLDATTANTYDTTGGGITSPWMRSMYTKVLLQGSRLADLSFVTSPTQLRRIFDLRDDSQPGTANYVTVLMSSPRPEFGFNMTLMPYFDGIPIIIDNYCVDASGNQDTIVVVDLSADKGFNLIVSKPLGMRGLAKVGTSEKSYVSFWGTTAYKAPRNVHLADDLTTT